MWLSNYCLLLVSKEKNKSKVELPDKKDVKSTEASNVFCQIPRKLYHLQHDKSQLIFPHQLKKLNWSIINEPQIQISTPEFKNLLIFILCYFIFYFFARACTWVWNVYSHLHVYGHTHVWVYCVYTCARRPEVDKKCLSRWFYTLLIEVGSVSEPWTHHFRLA